MNRYSYKFKAKKQDPAKKCGVPEGMEEEDLALNDVEHCEACEIHEDKIKQVTEHMPPLPTMKINPAVRDINDFRYEDFELTDYQCYDAIKAQVAV